MGGGEESKILEQIQGRPLYQQKLLKRGDWCRGKKEKVTHLEKSWVPSKEGWENLSGESCSEHSKNHKIKVFQMAEDLRKNLDKYARIMSYFDKEWWREKIWPSQAVKKNKQKGCTLHLLLSGADAKVTRDSEATYTDAIRRKKHYPTSCMWILSNTVQT